jgi:hypothetical protein
VNAPDDDTQQAMDRLAGLIRLRERAQAEDRPAMFHACQLLIGLKLGVLRQLAKPGGRMPLTPRAAERRTDAADDPR